MSARSERRSLKLCQTQSFSALTKFACALAQHLKKNLSAARTRAQFLESLMLSLAPTKEWALLIFALIFKSFLVVLKQKNYAFFQFLSAISKFYGKTLKNRELGVFTPEIKRDGHKKNPGIKKSGN